MKRLVHVCVAVVLLAAPVVLAAQTPAPNVFQPQDSLAKQEIAPAPLLYGAYALVWGVFVVYVFFLWRRIARVERELADVNRKLNTRASPPVAR